MRFEANEENVKKMYESATISSSGIYLGEIKQAYLQTGSENAEYIHFDFESNEGKTNFKIYVKNKDGSENFNVGHITSLCICLGLKEAEPVWDDIEFFNFEINEKVAKKAHRYIVFENKPIFVVLEKTYYTKQNGDEGWGMEFVCFLNTEKRRADEIVNGLAPEYVKKLKLNEWYKPYQGKKITYEAYKRQMQNRQSNYKGFNEPKIVTNNDYVEEDINFEYEEEILPF